MDSAVTRVEGPVVSVDIIVRNTNTGQFLIVKRATEPLKGEWWVPGGRVDKGETATSAAIRELYEETGLIADVNNLVPLGYYEDAFYHPKYKDRIHDIALVFGLTTFAASAFDDNGNPLAIINDEHEAWAWSDNLPQLFRSRADLSKRLFW